MDLLTFTSHGIYCERAKAYIDPVRPVERAIITHAHSDHARPGSHYYLAQKANDHILRLRLGEGVRLELKDWGESFSIHGVSFSFHPAGHIWGSSQVRVEYKGEVWCVSGDYKLEDDGFSPNFEPVRCHNFITESTFGLPVFHWQPQQQVFGDISAWWSENAREGKTSILTAYALGKAQRLIANLGNDEREVFVHGAIENVNQALIASGAELPKTTYVTNDIPKERFRGALILTPSSGIGSSWVRKFQPFDVATVSGWMAIRGIKRRRNAGKGFVLSDHADWSGLNEAVKMTGAERVFVAHGYTDAYARWLCEKGWDAKSIEHLTVRDDSD